MPDPAARNRARPNEVQLVGGRGRGPRKDGERGKEEAAPGRTPLPIAHEPRHGERAH